MVVSICLKGLILFILFWECESKIFEIKGLKSQRRSGILDTENGIEDANTSDPKETNNGTTDDSQVIRLTNISINSQPAEKYSVNNTNNTIKDSDTTTETDKNNHTQNFNELNPTNVTILDNKPLQEAHVLKNVEESTVPHAVINETNSVSLSTATALIINYTTTKEEMISPSDNKHEHENMTTTLNAIPSQISTNETTTENSQLDINIKMKASDDSISIIDIKTSSKQPNDKVNSVSITYMLKKFAARFMKLMKTFFTFKRFNDSEEELIEDTYKYHGDNYNLYVPISEDVSRTQYNSAEKQHVNVLREGALSLLGNDRNDM